MTVSVRRVGIGRVAQAISDKVKSQHGGDDARDHEGQDDGVVVGELEDDEDGIGGYVIDRDRVTCAGGTAPMDLMHALITQHHGAPFARLVSDNAPGASTSSNTIPSWRV